MDYIDDFISDMFAHNCAPANKSDIKADDTWRDYQIEGDPSSKKKGYYTLKIDGDYVSGAYGDRRCGEVIQYRGKPSREFTDEERREYARKREKDAKLKKKEKEHQNALAAEKSRERWVNARYTQEHSYLVKKKISGISTRVDSRGLLLIPMYDSQGIMWGVQSIDDSGSKLFPFGVAKKEKFMLISDESTNFDVIAIAEGYATAASVHEATGYACVVAFDSGNLPCVANIIQKKYPGSNIIIAADNDKSLTGQKSAQKASDMIKCSWVCPEDIGSDWSDVFLDPEKGKDYIKKVFKYSVGQPADRAAHTAHYLQCDIVTDTQYCSPPSYLTEELPPIEAYELDVQERISLYAGKDFLDQDWKEKLVYKEDGKLNPSSKNNVELILNNSPKFRSMFCYDEFAHEKIVVQCPPWELPERFTPRPLQDEDITWISLELEKMGLKPKIQDVSRILTAVIMRKSRNPAREYFNNLVWDRKQRLNTWLAYYAGAESDDPEYLAAVGTKWLTAAVKRVFHPGCKFDHVLIFEGKQGLGKSTLLRELATIAGRSYFDDTIKVSDLGQPATTPKLQGVLIIELAELTGLRKADMSNLKQQITIQSDRLVPKYANEARLFPRKFIMAGSINPVAGYLDDPTGLRRFWPVKTGSSVDIEAMKNDKEQLWAEAVYRYNEGIDLFLDKEMEDKLAHVHQSRKVVEPWFVDLEYLSNGKQFVSSQDIWQTLGFEKSKRNSKEASVIAKIMTELGFEYSRPMINGCRQYGWTRTKE